MPVNPAVHDVFLVGFPEFGKQDGEVLFPPGEIGTQVVGLGQGDIEKGFECRDQGGKGLAVSLSVRHQTGIVQRGDQFIRFTWEPFQ